MASFNLFVKEVTVNEWIAEGGTALEALGKETAEPAEPSLTPLLKSGGNGKRIEATLKVPAALATELAGGAKVTALTVHLSAKANVNGSANTKFGIVSPAVTGTPALANTQAWYTVSFTKEQAEAQTTATLEALVVLIEKVLLSGNSVYESYVSVETASGGTAVKLEPAAASAATTTSMAAAAVGIIEPAGATATTTASMAAVATGVLLPTAATATTTTQGTFAVVGGTRQLEPAGATATTTTSITLASHGILEPASATAVTATAVTLTSRGQLATNTATATTSTSLAVTSTGQFAGTATAATNTSVTVTSRAVFSGTATGTTSTTATFTLHVAQVPALVALTDTAIVAVALADKPVVTTVLADKPTVTVLLA